jgi:tetratricopeptide (TPR) repeat protein
VLPVERVLARIEHRHKVKTRVILASEIEEEAMRLPPDRLDRLIGTRAVPKDSKQPKEVSLGFADPTELTALHLVAASPIPVPLAMYLELLPKVIDWKVLFKRLRRDGVLLETKERVTLRPTIAKQLRAVKSAQNSAHKQWVKPLLKHGSIDCIYLAVLHLILMGKILEAAQQAPEMGLRDPDSPWASSALALIEKFNRPRLIKKLRKIDQVRLLLATANLLSLVGRSEDSLRAYHRLFRESGSRKLGWYRTQALLNSGVSAHQLGDAESAIASYEAAASLSRRRRDWLSLGRSLSNLAQYQMQTSLEQAVRTLDESEAAKRRAHDYTGLIVTQFIRGLVAIQRACPADAVGHFTTAAAQLIPEVHAHLGSDVFFNLGKSADESGDAKMSLQAFRQSLAYAELDNNAKKMARAHVALAMAMFNRRRFADCLVHCNFLASETWESGHDERMTGLHGIFVLRLRDGKNDSVAFRAAMIYARKHDLQEWIGRLIADRVSGNSQPPNRKSVVNLFRAAATESRRKNWNAAATILDRLWIYLFNQGKSSEERASTAASQAVAAFKRAENIVGLLEHLKGQYTLFWRSGKFEEGLNALAEIIGIARAAKRWNDVVAATDQTGVCFADMDRPGKAITYLKKAVALARAHRILPRTPLYNLAECLRRSGRTTLAIRTARQALRMFELDEEPQGYVSALHNYALALEQSGKIAQAILLYRRCAELARSHSLGLEMARAYLALSNVALEQNRLKDAESHCRRALREAKKAGAFQMEITCRYNLALICKRSGRYKDALHVLVVNESRNADALHRMVLKASLLEEIGRHTEAADAWQLAGALAHDLHDFTAMAYYRTRKQLIEEKRPSSVFAREQMADAADRFLTIIWKTKDRSTLDKRCLAAQKLYEREHLKHFAIELFRVRTHKLAELGSSGHLAEAFRSSVNVVIGSAIAGIDFAVEAAAWQTSWALLLRIPKSRFVHLFKATERWVMKTYRVGEQRRILLEPLRVVIEHWDEIKER